VGEQKREGRNVLERRKSGRKARLLSISFILPFQQKEKMKERGGENPSGKKVESNTPKPPPPPQSLRHEGKKRKKRGK